MLQKFKIDNLKVVPASENNPDIYIYSKPDEEDRKVLMNEFKIDDHTLHSALDPDETARIEFEPDHIAVIFKFPKNYSAQEQFYFRVSSIGLFLFNDKLVAVLSEDVPLFHQKPFAHVETVKEVFLKIINSSIFRYLEHLKVINMITDEIERKINISMENRYLINLFTLEKSLVYYLNAINSNGFLLEKLKVCGARVGFSQHDLDFLDDIIIENNQCYKQAEIHSNILASLMDARVSIVSNNLNILMKTLNLITIGIMVPTFVVSAFSMNVRIPLEAHPQAFYIVLFLAGVPLVAFLWWWRKNKW